MIVIPRTGETWLSRPTGEPVTIIDSYATAITGARVAHADEVGHRQNDGLVSFQTRYVPAVTRPHPLDRAIDGAIKTDLGLGVRTDRPDRMRLAVLTGAPPSHPPAETSTTWSESPRGRPPGSPSSIWLVSPPRPTPHGGCAARRS